MRLILSVVVLLLAMACGALKPATISAGDTCARCRRTIDDIRLAGEIIDSHGRALKFRTIGCMAKYLQQSPADVEAMLVTDYASGAMLRAGGAMFVAATIDKATGERDYLAFQQIKDAVAAAAAHSASPVDWSAVRQIVAGRAN